MTNHHMTAAEKWFDKAVDGTAWDNPGNCLKLAQVQAILAVAEEAQRIADELTDRGGITFTTELGFEHLKAATEQMGRLL